MGNRRQDHLAANARPNPDLVVYFFIAKCVADVLEVPLHDVIHKPDRQISRDDAGCLARRVFAYSLKVDAELSYRRIARLLSVDPALVVRKVRAVEDMRDDPHYDQLCDRINAQVAEIVH